MTWTLGGLPLHSLRLTHPASGAWVADVSVASEVPVGLTGPVPLVLPGLTLQGTVVSGGVSFRRQRVRVVGGNGRLGTEIPGQHFRLAEVRTIASWLCSTAGEMLDAANSDVGLLAWQLDHWQHHAGTAAQGLDLLAQQFDTQWRVSPQGQVILGDLLWRPDDAVELEADLLEEDLTNRVLTCVTTDVTIQPGTTFRGRRVLSVDHRADGSRWRSLVRW